MKARRFILQCASFVLLLVFSQKAGTGLFLHNLLHNQDNNRPFQSSAPDGNGKEISFACNCIDDFLMPFTEAEEIVLPSPGITYTHPRAHFEAGVYHRPVFFFNLRGPPSLVA